VFTQKKLFSNKLISLITLSMGKRGVSLIEIMFAMGILALALVPIMGVMQSGQNQSVRDESEVEATEAANRIMTTLMNDIPFICLLPGGSNQFTNQGLVDGYNADSLNKAAAGGSIIIDHPGTVKDESTYNTELLYANNKSSYRDDRGITYIISVYCQVVPIRLQYFETNETSHWSGNKMAAGGGAWAFESSDLIDETGEGDTKVFGDAPGFTGADSGRPYKWLQGDKKDGRLKKIVVTVAYEKQKGCLNFANFDINSAKGVKTISLVAYKSKLSD
jgi:type II secretory pathway pseudopilin PulG